jgi:molybdopterin synthase sulfur carrier subunit
VQLKIAYFAWLRERMGRGEETLAAPQGVTTVAHLADWLRARDEAGRAAFADLRTVRAAVNQTFAQPDAELHDGDEVAFFPPVTGG